MKLRKLFEPLFYALITINFIIFVIKNYFVIKKIRHILFYISKRKFVGSGFGHNSIILNILKNRNFNFKEVLIIDFTIGINTNNHNIFEYFGVKTINFHFFFKSLNNFFHFKKKKALIKIISNILKKLRVNVISSLDDFYFDNLENKKIFFQNYLKNDYLNSESRLIRGKKLYRLHVSRANKDMMEAISLYNLKKNNFLKLNSKNNYKIRCKLNLTIDENKKNILIYRRYKKDDYKCGSPDINYYLKLINLIDPKNYNIICVGDFTIDERKKINKIGAFSNLNPKDDPIFYIWACNNSHVCLLECGGGLSLPIMMGKKCIIFNSVALAHLMPNSIILPKEYIKKKLSLNYHEILTNYMGPKHICDIELQFTDIEIIKKELDFLLNNSIKNYIYSNADFVNNKNIRFYKSYNQFISNYWIK